MAIMDLFSKRGKPAPAQDVLTYDALPSELRVQIVHIWRDGLGDRRSDRYHQSYSAQLWEMIKHAICREHGVFGLALHKRGFEAAVEWFMEPSRSVDKLLDLVELSFKIMDSVVREQWFSSERRNSAIMTPPDDAITELNERFLEHAVG